MPDANGNLPEEDKRTGLIGAASTPGESVTTYTPSTATAGSAVGKGYTAKGVSVGDDDTVQGQLSKITATNSPLMMQAERRARDEVAPRGLLNSSLAIGHAQEAVISQAMPIAQQDASTYFTAKTKTADAENAALNFGANAENQASVANAQLLTDASKFNAGAKNDAAARAAQDANAAALARLDASTRKDIANLDAATRTNIANQDTNTRLTLGQLEAQTSRANAQLQADTSVHNAQLDAQTRLSTAQLDANTRLSTAQLDAQTRLQVSQMDQQTQMQIAEISNRNRELLQANQNAANMMNSASNAITNISIQPNLSKAAKDAAIATQLNLLQEGLRATGDVASLNLSGYFQQAAGSATGGGGSAAGSVALNSENFDRERYLRENPDVANSDQDPYQHYVNYGQREGRTGYILA